MFVKWRVRYIEVLFHTFYCNFGRDIEIISFVISRTSLNRGSLNRGSTVLVTKEARRRERRRETLYFSPTNVRLEKAREIHLLYRTILTESVKRSCKFSYRLGKVTPHVFTFNYDVSRACGMILQAKRKIKVLFTFVSALKVPRVQP